MILTITQRVRFPDSENPCLLQFFWLLDSFCGRLQDGGARFEDKLLIRRETIRFWSLQHFQNFGLLWSFVLIRPLMFNMYFISYQCLKLKTLLGPLKLSLENPHFPLPCIDSSSDIARLESTGTPSRHKF
jgi:hypothetical protein